jgi:hypothetical protein
VTSKTIPFVTVLIDRDNHERLIERVITSVLEQDKPMVSVEIVVAGGVPTFRTPENISLYC